LLYAASSKPLYVTLITENCLLLTVSFGTISWYYILGAFLKYPKTFCITKKGAIRLITGQGNRTSCRQIFKQLEILPLKSQYIYSILLFVGKHKHFFTTNSDRHNIQTRQRDNLHVPSSSLTVFQNGVYYSGIKLFNKLPVELKQLVGFPKKFKIAVRRYLVSHCFYTLNEFVDMD
jgi:hypothetical protein